MHLLVHSTIKPHSCPYCGMKFKTDSYLKQHTATHTGGKRFTCKHCSQIFGNWKQCKQHLIDKHKEGSWLVCSLCPKKFLLGRELNPHLMKHGGVKHYVCSECSKQFWRSQELTRHQFVKHSFGDGRYACGFCLRAFFYKFEVYKHLPGCVGQ